MAPRKPTKPLLPLARQNAICELAEQVALMHSKHVRVNPLEIAQAKLITISFGAYGDGFDGMLEHKSGRFHIYLNGQRLQSMDSARCRFTIAHELGHFFVDEHRLALQSGRVPAHGSKCEFESRNLIEQEADLFASNLLMPPSRFFPAAKKAPIGLRGILKLASDFSVSIMSAAIKYCNSDVLPCAVIKWNSDGYAWKWLSTETFRQQFIKTIESIDQIPRESATSMALQGRRVPPEGYFQTGSTAATWFPFTRHNSHQNVIVMEEAIPLGRFGVLTFLYPDSGAYNFPDLC
jgi:Zn-dependent peptidase ImmA (M78 family)